MRQPIGIIRRGAGVLQKDVADYLGVDASTLSRKETGETHPERQGFDRLVILKAISVLAERDGSGIQIDIEDLTGKPKHRRKKSNAKSRR